jgi:hypothetical protein
VDGESPSEALATDLGLDLIATESALDTPGPTEVLNHILDDVCFVSSGKVDKTATVDGETPSEPFAEVGAIESKLEEPAAVEVLDHVPDDISNVLSNNDDSTAAVDGETPSEALAADINYGTAGAEAELDKTAAIKVLDSDPGVLSNVSLDTDESTTAVDGRTPFETLAADIKIELAAAKPTLDNVATEHTRNDRESVYGDRVAKPWDESDELMTGHHSGSDTELPARVEVGCDENTDTAWPILAPPRDGLTGASGSGEATEADEDATESPVISCSNQDVGSSNEDTLDKVVAASIEETDSREQHHYDVTKGASTDNRFAERVCYR